MKDHIPSKCIRCDKSFWWKEVITGKMPENVWFCIDCLEYLENTAPDTKIYEWEEEWIVTEYEPWLTVSNEVEISEKYI